MDTFSREEAQESGVASRSAGSATAVQNLSSARRCWERAPVKCMNTTLDMTFSVYMKKDVSFNGAVEMAAFILGKRVSGWTAKTLTTSYAEYTLVVSHDDMTLTEYVELQVRVNGTAGNVYVDDFSVSQ